MEEERERVFPGTTERERVSATRTAAGYKSKRTLVAQAETKVLPGFTNDSTSSRPDEYMRSTFVIIKQGEPRAYTQNLVCNDR